MDLIHQDLGAAVKDQFRRVGPGEVWRGVCAEPLVTRGAPAAEILRATQSGGADLIVMGTHGRIGLARMLGGSVAEEVVRKAPWPVLTVRPGHLPGIAVKALDNKITVCRAGRHVRWTFPGRKLT